jgi:formylglycine-generating enzyme
MFIRMFSIRGNYRPITIIRPDFRARCVDCHLPPKGQGYLKEKMIAAARDVYGLVFKDSADYNWELKSTLEYAQHHVFKESCLHCHQNLFPLTLTKEGQDAHLYYTRTKKNYVASTAI